MSSLKPFHQLTDRDALKCHGYVFSDEEDCSSSDGGLSDFDEMYERLKPRPLKISPDQLIVIKPDTSSVVRKDLGLQEKKQTINKKSSSRNEQKTQTKINISVNNFYGVLELEQSDDNNENAENFDVENTLTEEAKVRKRKVSKRRKRKKAMKVVKSETPLESNSCSCLNCSGGCTRRNRQKCQNNELKNEKNKKTRARDHVNDDDKKYILDLNFFLDLLPWYFWTEEMLYTIAFLEAKTETQKTSWDHLSKNHIYRSHKLLEQEYLDIEGSVGSTAHENRRTIALRNLLAVTGMPCMAAYLAKIWTVLDSDTFLSVVGILIAAFIYTRCK